MCRLGYRGSRDVAVGRRRASKHRLQPREATAGSRTRIHRHRGAEGRTFSLRRASLMGRVVRGMGATVLGDSSAIAGECVRVQLMGRTSRST
jgi:hypothetical protein